MKKIMLNENNLPKYFCLKAVNTASYVLNRVLVRSVLKKTPYELWKSKKPSIGYFEVFSCKCSILNTKDNFGKFDAKSDVKNFLSSSLLCNAFKVFNKKNMVVEKSIHVIFYELNNALQGKTNIDDDLGLEDYMRRLQIEERSKVDPKKEDHP